MSINLNDPNVLELAKSLREDPKGFVAIVGAGLSRPAGLPGWFGLRDSLLDKINLRAESLPQSQRDALLDRVSSLRNDTKLWDVFNELKELLHKPLFESLIRENLSTEGKDCPENYLRLWKCGFGAVVNYNLDNFCEMAYSRYFDRPHVSFSNNQPSYFSTLDHGDRFIYHIHGFISDTESWVLTEDKRRELYANQEFNSFNTKVWESRKTFVAGFNVEDISYELILNSLESRGGKHSKHFIALPTNDEYEIKRFESKGFRVIPYLPEDGSHSEIDDLLNFLIDFSFSSESYGSVYSDENHQVLPRYTVEELSMLAIKDVTSCRSILNSMISAIIKPGEQPGEEDIKNLEDFYKKYLLPIHIAWLVSANSDKSEIFGYEIKKSLGRGNFGHVYLAEKDSEVFAIKVLLEEVKNNFDYTNSFRRGVNSMRILRDNNLSGMVTIKEAFEIPACIVMSYIEGPTLREAVESRMFDLLETLSVLFETASTVDEAHSLSVQVIHRDLKPENIIIQDYFIDGDCSNVKVLDFDLSWYKGAIDSPVIQDALTKGFSAPEQINYSSKTTDDFIRNTAVDTFSMGMVCYYALTRNTPRPNEHKFERFRDEIESYINNSHFSRMKSIPVFLADTIVKSTFDDPSERISFKALLERISLVKKALEGEEIYSNHPIFILEIACIIDGNTRNIEISESAREISVFGADTSKGLKLYLSDYMGKPNLVVELSKIRNEADSRNVKKYLEKARSRTESMLSKAGFKAVEGEVIQGGVCVSARYELGNMVSLAEVKDIANNIAEAKSLLEISSN